MTITSRVETFTASEARENLYELIKSASKGTKAYEITLRGSDSVIMINKAELEAWQETLDILSDREETMAIRRAKKQKKTLSHKQILKAIGLDDETEL